MFENLLNSQSFGFILIEHPSDQITHFKTHPVFKDEILVVLCKDFFFYFSNSYASVGHISIHECVKQDTCTPYVTLRTVADN